MSLSRTLSWLAILVSFVLYSGCAASLKEPDLGQVKGKVTVDGQPGANLMVTFEPQGSATGKAAAQTGAGSVGTTDAGGNYELTYKGTAKGAAIGTHKVRITSAAGGGPAGGEKAAKPLNIPAKFNTDSQLTKEVKKGDNKIDLEITSK